MHMNDHDNENVCTYVRMVLIALLFIVTMGLMVIDRRAPLFVLMGFCIVGFLYLVVYAIYMAHHAHDDTHHAEVYHMGDYRTRRHW